MGYKLIAQVVLIIAALVIVFSFIQPTLGTIKTKQNELENYTQAVNNASQFNARLRELISIRDSFSSENIQALERLIPVEIDELEVMRNIEAIFSDSGVTITRMTAEAYIKPIRDETYQSSSVVQAPQNYSDVSYQDFSVTGSGSYAQLRSVLTRAESSDILLEIIELSFETSSVAAVDENDVANQVQQGDGDMQFTIVFRAFGLPVTD